MRLALVVSSTCLLLMGGCGYVGPIVPPSPLVPARVVDLTAVERGDQIVIQFTTPAETIDNIAIEEFSEIDLRLGSVPADGFNQAQWENSARLIQVSELYAGGSGESPHSLQITKRVAADPWLGKKVMVQVRTAVKKRGHYSDWSNPATLNVMEPLPAPDVRVTATAAGYKLTWQDVRPGAHYDVLRQGPGEKTPIVNGVAEKPEFVDSTAQWDIPYQYSVVAKLDGAESLPSNPIPAQSPDLFPPAVPSNVVALAGPDTIELTWTRNTETDLKGYIVFRSIGNGPFEQQGDLLTIPSFSDHKAEHGKQYKYVVRSVDLKNNRSEPSAPADVSY